MVVVANEQKVVNSKDIKKLSLEKAISIAIENNRNILSSYLNRQSQKLDLSIAKSEFSIKNQVGVNINTSKSIAGEDNEGGENASQQVVLVNETSLKTITGGQISLEIESIKNNETNVGSSNYELSFSQPLFKGFGKKVALAPLRIAKINENINIKNLEIELIDVVTSTIKAYREILQAQQRFEISKRAFKRAKLLETITQNSIDLGNIPKKNIIQARLQTSQRKLDHI